MKVSSSPLVSQASRIYDSSLGYMNRYISDSGM